MRETILTRQNTAAQLIFIKPGRTGRRYLFTGQTDVRVH